MKLQITFFSFTFIAGSLEQNIVKCCLISLVHSFFRKHSSNSASFLCLLIIDKTLLSCNPSLICSISLQLTSSTLYVHIVSTKSWGRMALNELMQGIPALYCSSRSTIAAKESSNLKISFNFCCSSKSAKSSMVDLNFDSSVLIHKLHAKLLRNLCPAQPEYSANKTIFRNISYSRFSSRSWLCAGNSYSVVHETKQQKLRHKLPQKTPLLNHHNLHYLLQRSQKIMVLTSPNF